MRPANATGIKDNMTKKNVQFVEAAPSVYTQRLHPAFASKQAGAACKHQLITGAPRAAEARARATTQQAKTINTNTNNKIQCSTRGRRL